MIISFNTRFHAHALVISLYDDFRFTTRHWHCPWSNPIEAYGKHLKARPSEYHAFWSVLNSGNSWTWYADNIW
jgi:hypothetical protein